MKLAGLCSVQANLAWESKTVNLDVHPLQMKAQMEFRFKNRGANLVEILSVRTTCGYLKASASTNRIASGESGTIDVTFDFREKTGSQRKAVAVRSSDVPKKPVMLYVQVSLPKVYRLSKKRIEWFLDGEYEAKVCRLVNCVKEPVRLVSAVSSSDLLDVELRTIREGFEYEVRVSPKPLVRRGRFVITIQTECPPELKASLSYRFDAGVR